MRSHKGSRWIVVRAAEYRWRATGDDGYISIGIWPANDSGSYIHGNFRYHESWLDNGDGSRSSPGSQIVITNRIIRRIIEYAIRAHDYDPNLLGKGLNLRILDDVIRWDDAIHGASDANSTG